MNEKRIESLVKLAELRREISLYLNVDGRPQDQEARRNAEENIRTLSSIMREECITDKTLETVYSDVEHVISGRNNKDIIIAKLEEAFRLKTEQKISQEIRTEITPELYIEGETADLLYHYFDLISLDTSENVTLVFDTCRKTAYSRPMLSFQHTMQLMEKYPNLLSNENYAHPGYVYKESKQHTFEKCPICGGAGYPYFRAFAYEMTNFSYPHLPVKLWMKCGTCGMMYTWKFAEEFLALSDQKRMVYPRPEKHLATFSGSSGTVLAIWSDILNHIKRYYTKGTKLLEVGPGRGDLLAVAMEMGYQVSGIEIVPEDAQRVSDLLNIPLWNGDFLNYDVEETYSVLVMGDIIEHVTDPVKALEKAKSLLEDDGILWLSTPNFESAFSKLHKFEDPMWKTSNHITYFSYQGFKDMAEKCGFSVEEYSVSRRYNGSMELILKKKLQ